MRSVREVVGVVAVLAGGCVPDGSLGGGGAGGASASLSARLCVAGVPILAVDDDGLSRDAMARGRDGALLVARRPAGAPFPAVPDGRSTLGEAAPEPCGPAAHLAFDGFDLRERELTVACGGLADAPESVTGATTWSEAWAAVAACEGDAWVWLWTPRTCTELTRLGVVDVGEDHLVAPVVATTRRARVRCLIDDTGTWTRLYAVEGSPAALDAIDVTLDDDLFAGLERAADLRGGAAPRLLVFTPPAQEFHRFRFRCARPPSKWLDLVTTSASVAKGLMAVGGTEHHFPPSLGTFEVLRSWSSEQGLIPGIRGWGDRDHVRAEHPSRSWPDWDCGEECVENGHAARWRLDDPEAMTAAAMRVAMALPPSELRVTPRAYHCDDTQNRAGRWEVLFR